MYPSVARTNDRMKLAINNATKKVGIKYKIKNHKAVVLDDHNFQSTKQLYRVAKIIVTERNKETFELMMQNTMLPEYIKTKLTLYNCSAETLTPYLSNIDFDVMDFMGTWSKNKYVFFQRLVNNCYADKAVVRLTVCARGECMSHDKCVDLILKDIQSLKCSYVIKAIPLKNWGIQLKTNGIETIYRNNVCLTTKSNMLNMIFVLRRTKTLTT